MVSISKKLASLSDFVEVKIDQEQLNEIATKCLATMKEEYDSQKNAYIEQKDLYKTLKTNKDILTANERKSMQTKINELKQLRQSYQDNWLVLYEKLMLTITKIPDYKLEHKEILEKIKGDFQNPTWRV
jgi:hypothetical protein